MERDQEADRRDGKWPERIWRAKLTCCIARNLERLFWSRGDPEILYERKLKVYNEYFYELENYKWIYTAIYVKKNLFTSLKNWNKLKLTAPSWYLQNFLSLKSTSLINNKKKEKYNMSFTSGIFSEFFEMCQSLLTAITMVRSPNRAWQNICFGTVFYFLYRNWRINNNLKYKILV